MEYTVFVLSSLFHSVMYFDLKSFHVKVFATWRDVQP